MELSRLIGEALVPVTPADPEQACRPTSFVYDFRGISGSEVRM